MKFVTKLVLLLSMLCSATAISASKELKVGDIWAYKNPPGEATSTLTILKIENYPRFGKIVHIRIDGLRLNSPVTGEEFDQIPHLPFQAKAVERSITHRVGTAADIPDFSEGYGEWRAAFDEKKAGVFTSTVRRTIDDLMTGEWIVDD
ncbi:hypothetical protein J2X84_000866 [Pseudomonas corrugata]|jgi:hypothetical protein|uniref:hypothetical protein n=1 Tax=Pseudomonas corrugata TaxID=47879 RepID=UPI002861BBCA|nr:hypothetical protein [Pseudomonas corrugata]MDR7282051.1 hypothetical protein [Pseudomonas corrugata]